RHARKSGDFSRSLVELVADRRAGDRFARRASAIQNVLQQPVKAHLGGSGQPKQWEKETFERALAGRGVVQKKLNGTRYWRGVSLTEEGKKLAQLSGQAVPCHRNTKVAAVAAE
ncbi:hypothetical protein, partial [Rhodovulum sp. 12E13]|uniref:hypothetical protein n=1 Tax=Rhodovulum sp. 12E13 TaxID=2203891 RepID=UPI001F2581CD